MDFDRHPWAAQARLGAKPSEPIRLLDDTSNELAAMQIMHLPGGGSGVRSLDIDMVCLTLCGSEEADGPVGTSKVGTCTSQRRPTVQVTLERDRLPAEVMGFSVSGH